MTVGDKILWKCRPGVMIPAVIAEVTLDRVKIRMYRPDGEGAVRWVAPGKLTPLPGKKLCDGDVGRGSRGSGSVSPGD